MTYDIPLLVGGLALLVLSGEVLVRNAAGMAVKASIPPLIVGLTVVSIGTSAPEIFASVQAALAGNPGLAIGNVVGSNIANLALILGVTALIHPVKVDRSVVTTDWPVMMAGTVMFGLFAWDLVFTHFEGTILLLGTVALMSFLIYRSQKARRTAAPDADESDGDFERFAARPYPLLLLGTAVACVGLYFGAEWFISGARGIATAAGVSDHIIGVTVVAFGTSVPELVASGAAAVKGQSDLALGNLVGSNIFNIFLALGATSLIEEMPVDPAVLSDDLWWMGGIALLLLPMMLHTAKFQRWKGVVLLGLYLAYIGTML